MLSRFVVFAVACGSLLLALQGRAQAQAVLDLPPPEACPIVTDLHLQREEERAWTSCEKWVWHCVRQGLEANLYAKECVPPREPSTRALKIKFMYAPFLDPDRYKDTNLLTGGFLYTILTRREYTEQIRAQGIRIVGAYFDRMVNLENVTTDKNLVLDHSIFKGELRLTNFRTDRNVSLDGSNVRGRIFLWRAHIAGTLFMEEGVYDQVDAADMRIGGSLEAPSSIFNAPVRLDRVRVEGKVSFIRTRLTELTAWDTTVGSKLEMRYAHVRGRIDLTGSNIAGDLRLQRLDFGRQREGGGQLTCDWDLSGSDRFFLSPDLQLFKDRPDVYARIIEEAIVRRSPTGVAEYPCVRRKDSQGNLIAVKDNQLKTHHEVLLRDMRIGGTLCLIDITGEIKGKTLPALTMIALDGTEARSTILRWKKSDSPTVWQAVHFKTKNLFIDLHARPKRYFIDNLEIGNISFIRQGEFSPEEQQEESRAFLCDARPAPGAHDASYDKETHERIIGFFHDNMSRSPQPFGEVVERLNNSNASSLMLKMAFSQYKLQKGCSSSRQFKEQGPVKPEDGFSVAASTVAGLTATDLDESRNVALDAVCMAGLTAYREFVSYGHQLHKILFWIIGFVLFFRLLLMFDKATPGTAGEASRPTQLGILYAVDMFTPFIKLNPQHAELRPNRKSLRAYLLFHRVVGLVLTSFLVIGIYASRW